MSEIQDPWPRLKSHFFTVSGRKGQLFAHAEKIIDPPALFSRLGRPARKLSMVQTQHLATSVPRQSLWSLGCITTGQSGSSRNQINLGKSEERYAEEKLD